MRDELVAIKDEYATPRRTKIEDIEYDTDIESLIQREEMVVTVTEAGYIKRVPLNAYKAQKRGGKGQVGHGDQGRRLCYPSVRGFNAHASLVLLVQGACLQDEGLQTASRLADFQGQAFHQPVAA